MNNDMVKYYRDLWNYYKTHKKGERIERVHILFSDLIGGVSPDTDMKIDFFHLNQHEKPIDLVFEFIDGFVDSGGNNDLRLNFYDVNNTSDLLDGFLQLQAGVYPSTTDEIADSTSGIKYVFKGIDIHNYNYRDIQLHFTATDLTLLTAGECYVYVKIEVFDD